MGPDRTDFRIARLERRVFGTQTPSGGTMSGVSVTTSDLITRIAELESQLASVAAPASGHGDPVTLALTGSFGARYYDIDTGFWWIKGPTAWQQQP